MIPTRTYTETENRDQNIYLGIDGTDIPFEYFKGVYFEHGLVFTDDVKEGVQFVVDTEKNCVNLVDLDPNSYVTREDLENDEWIIVMRPVTEPTSTWQLDLGNEFFAILDARNDLYKLYNTGRQGLLKASKKVYDDEKLYYMKYGSKFDTRKKEGSTLTEEVNRHIRFVLENYLSLGVPDLFMHTKKNVWNKFIKELQDIEKKEEEENKNTPYCTDFPRTRFYEEEINGERVVTGVLIPRRKLTIYFVEGKTNYFFISRSRTV